MNSSTVIRFNFCLEILGLDALTLVFQGRDHLTHEKKMFAHVHPQMKRLEDVVRELKPTAIIGKPSYSVFVS